MMHATNARGKGALTSNISNRRWGKCCRAGTTKLVLRGVLAMCTCVINKFMEGYSMHVFSCLLCL